MNDDNLFAGCGDEPGDRPRADTSLLEDAGAIADLRTYLRRRVRNAADVDDLVQDVYLRVLSTPQPGLIDNARGFLRRIASNLLIDNHRRRAARMVDDHMPLEENLVDDGVATPERIATARDELAVLGRALKAMTPVARDAFLLVRVEGHSHKEVARTLGITPKAVSHHVERTLARLAERVMEVDR